VRTIWFLGPPKTDRTREYIVFVVLNFIGRYNTLLEISNDGGGGGL